MHHNTHLRQAKSRIGEKAGKYTLERVIDVGGMAAVFQAKRWRTRVAVKVMHKTYMRMQEARERFARESYVANRIDHESVVKVIDDGELEDGAPFFTMELLTGCSLEQHLQNNNTLPAGESLAIADAVLDVLVAAHAATVVHRDIKPGNVFLTSRGEIKVLDFGLARLHDGGPSKSLTRTGTVIGTAHYMSPEQALRKPELVDERTDLWAVGAILFRCLAGRTVHDVHGTGQSLIAAATQSAPPLSSVMPGAPVALAAVVDRALAFRKEDRFAEAVEMLDAVRDCLDPARDSVDWDAIQHEDLPAPSGLEDEVPVSVTFTETAGGDSIIVSFEDDDGVASRYQLRPKSEHPESDDQPISGFDVELLDEPFD